LVSGLCRTRRLPEIEPAKSPSGRRVASPSALVAQARPGGADGVEVSW
jgi:hypothetical protein